MEPSMSGYSRMETSMHGLWISESILQAALKQAKEYRGKRIKAISVKILDENFQESDWLHFCLEVAAMGTIAERARIEIELAISTAEGLLEVAIEVD